MVSDDYSTIQDVLKNPVRGAWGQMLNSSKGKYGKEIPPPSFFIDTFHKVKVVAKYLFGVVNYGEAFWMHQIILAPN